MSVLEARWEACTILDRLVREQENLGSRLIGVRALFLYPLNALINSQYERVRARTAFSGGDLHFLG